MGLTELGVDMSPFVEFNWLVFQKMTSDKTVEGTVTDVVKLNNLSESHTRTLLDLVKQVFTVYDGYVRGRG